MKQNNYAPRNYLFYESDRIMKSYASLIVALNNVGYYPKSIEEAKLMARELRKRGWEE